MTKNDALIKNVGINIIGLWKSILRMCLGLLPAFAIGIIIKNMVSFSNIWTMGAFVLLYTIIYSIFAWLFSMNQFEKQLAKAPMRFITSKLVRH